MTSTRVIFKPAGVVALTVLSTAIVTAIVIGFRGGVPSNASGNAAGSVTKMRAVNSPGTLNEIMEDEVRLVRLNADQTQKRDWLFLGPLSSGSTIPDGAMTSDNKAKMRQIIGTSYLPTEAKYKARENVAVTVGKNTYRWRKVKGSAFNFQEMFAPKEASGNSLTNVVVYGYTNIESKAATKKHLRLRSDDGAIVWVNGKRVYMGNEIRGVDIEDVIPIDLRAGQNNVLIKVGQGSNGWGMSFHLDAMP